MRRQILMGGFLALSLATTAQAEQPFYIGGKVGVLQAEEARLGEVTQGAVVLGLRPAGSPFGLEAEFSGSLDKGEIKNSTAEWDMDTLGLFLTARTPGDFYVKGRGGVIRRDVSYRGEFGPFLVKSRDKEDSEAWGAGLGWDVGAATVEAEYTRIDKDFDFYSVGVNAKF